MHASRASRSRRRVATAILVGAALAAVTPSGARTEGEQYYVYSQNAAGKLSVNGTVLDKLPGEFNVTAGGIYNPDDAWAAIALDGQRRYSLRRDGLVRSDGSKLFALPFDEEFPSSWVSIAVSGGTTYCLREDGLLARGDDLLARLPRDVFSFVRTVARAGHSYSLRSDGSIYRDDAPVPVYRLVGGLGSDSGLPDGFAADTVWIALALHPSEPFVYAMRIDGIIRRANITDTSGDRPAGEGVAALPFDLDYDDDDDGELDRYPLLDDAYVDIELKENGVWVAVAGDGRVYSANNSTSPVTDLPGEALELGDAYTDLATAGNAFWAVRSDGYAYRGDADVPRLTLPGGDYGRIAASTSAPNLGDAQEHPPKCVVYKTRTVVGTPLDLPVMATDIETASADLVVTPTAIPSDASGSAAVWDAAARVLRWHAPQVPGQYRFKFKVDDGHSIERFEFSLKVVAPDPGAATAPTVPSITGGRPVIGRAFSFTVVTDDAGGDAVQVAVDAAKYPFDAGAAFDPVTRVFSWTPSATDQGDREARFKLSDGTRERTLTVKLAVRAGLGL